MGRASIGDDSKIWPERFDGGGDIAVKRDAKRQTVRCRAGRYRRHWTDTSFKQVGKMPAANAA